MIDSAEVTDGRAQTDVGPGAVPVVLGVGALMLRLRIQELPAAEGAVVLGALFGAILLGSLMVPVAPGAERLSATTTLGVGFAALALVVVVAGRPPAAPFAAWALPLSLLAAVSEEALFRRVAYGWLSRYGAVLAIVGSAALFAAIHLPFYGMTVLPVDFGAGLLFGWQRWASGTWTVPAATHAAANFVAVILR